MICNSKDLGKETVKAFFVIKKHSKDTNIDVSSKDGTKILLSFNEEDFDPRKLKLNKKTNIIKYIYWDVTLKTKETFYLFDITKDKVYLTRLDENLYYIEIDIDNPNIIHCPLGDKKTFNNLYINCIFAFKYEREPIKKKKSSMVRILASSFNNYHEVDEKKIPNEIDNSNGIVDDIKNNINGNNAIVFIASSPTNIEKTDMYSKSLFESLKLSGITFKKYYVLDNRTLNKIDEYISESDIIFLSGGDTYEEIEFFKKLNLKEKIKDYKGLIIGQSAGAINMASDVFNSPEEMDESEPVFFKGLGLTNINVEPHFIYDTSNFDEALQYQRDAILLESYNRKIYGQCDGSHILIDRDNNVSICGETYLISNGKISLIRKEK